MRRQIRYKTVNALIDRTMGKTFRLYWKEMRRHEKACQKIFENDPDHIHRLVPLGSINQVAPKRRLISNLWECSVCHKILTEKEVAASKKRRNEA